MDGKRWHCNYFFVFLTDKGRYNPLDYFRMEIIEEIRFFFFSVENPVHNQSLSAEMVRKLKNKVRGLRRKKRLKSTAWHSPKNLKHYLCCVVFRGVFRTQLNIHDGAFLQKTVSGFWPLSIFAKALHRRCSPGF